MAMGDVIGRLAVVLGLDTASFETGARKSAKTTADMGDRFEKMGARVGTAAKALVGLGAAFAGSQLVNQVKDMAVAGLEFASSLGEQAQQLGVTAGELQKYRYIASQVGIDQEQMDKGLAKLSITLGDLANGAKAPAAALQRLGFDQARIAEISRMTAGDAIPLLADAFGKLKSPTEAASIAADLFGSKLGGKFLSLLMGGRQQIDELTNAYKRLGIEISDSQIAKADKAMDDYAAAQKVFEAKRAQIAVDNADGLIAGMTKWEEFKTKLLVVFGELGTGADTLDKKLTTIAEQIPDPWMGAGDEIAKAIEGAFAEGLERAKANIASFRQTLGELDAAWLRGQQAVRAWRDRMAADILAIPGYARKLYEGVKTYLQDRLDGVLNWLAGKLKWAGDLFFMLYDRVVGHSYIPDMVDEIGVEMRRLDDVMVKPIEKATKKSAEAFRQLQQDVRGIMDRLFPEQAAIRSNEQDFATIERAFKSGVINRDTFNTSLDRLGNERSANRTEPPDSAALPAFDMDALHSIEGIDDALARLSDRLPELNYKWSALGDALKERGREAFDALTHHIEGVLLGFESLGDAVRNLVSQLASMALQQFVFKPLGAALGVPGFASGTSFAPGGLALVGERGPELVNLPRGSRVNTAQDTRAMMRRGGDMNLSIHVSGPMSAAEARMTGHQVGRAALRQIRQGSGLEV